MNAWSQLPWKSISRRLLRRLPLFERARDLADQFSPGTSARRREDVLALKQLQRDAAPHIQGRLYGKGPKSVLFLGMGKVSFVYLETFLRKSFELAGYRPIVLIPRNHLVRKAYRALGERRLCSMDDYRPLVGNAFSGSLEGVNSLEQLLSVEFDGVRCGRYAASTLMRVTRSGQLDLSDAAVRASASRALGDSLDYAVAAASMLDHIRPDAVVFTDRGYSPAGELFDTCLLRGIPAYTWNAAHRNDAVMLKRYTDGNADVHPASLSSNSWTMLRSLPWTDAYWRKVRDELYGCYASGEWYGEVATQVNKNLVSRDELIGRLSLDPAKKTAVVFPHIFWDATFFWGEDLFSDYEAWFVEVLEAACRNDALNWIIKVHPANLVKDARDGVSGEHSEISAIRRCVGALPPHVQLLSAETDISTLSLYESMDYCLTVRGTVGIEAACFGVRVLTAGTGRYDRLGFTHDFDSRERYRSALSGLQHVSQMTAEEVELARRYAYGVFNCRTANLRTIRMRYSQDARADLEVSVNKEVLGNLSEEASDIRSIARWLRSDSEDYFDAEAIGYNELGNEQVTF